MARINGDWFRQKLTQKNKSQRAMAKHLGLDPSAITLMLRGERRMQLEEARQIAGFMAEPLPDVLRAAGLPLPESASRKPTTGTPLEGLKQRRDELLAEVDALNKAIAILEK